MKSRRRIASTRSHELRRAGLSISNYSKKSLPVEWGLAGQTAPKM